MALTRIGTLQLQQMTLGNALKVQGGIFDAQQQISSGLKASTFADLNGQVEMLASLENRFAKAEQFVKNNTQSVTRMESVHTAVSQILEVVTATKNLTGQRRNGSIAGSLAYEQQIRAAFSAVADQLNINVEGRYLFSGARTDTKPVDPDEFPDPLELGVPDSGYYLGSTEDITQRAAEDVEVTFPARADNEAFQYVMAGLATAIEGHDQDNDGMLVSAYGLLEDAEQLLIELQAQIGTTQRTVEDASARHITQKQYWQVLKEDTVSADIIGLSTKLAVDQATLQATFQAFARINSLRLSDYLQ